MTKIYTVDTESGDYYGNWSNYGTYLIFVDDGGLLHGVFQTDLRGEALLGVF